MQASTPTSGNLAAGPLRRLKINATWESELVWGPLQLSPARSPSQVPSSPALPHDTSLSWPEESPLFPVCFDFREDYLQQEWELLLALFCRHQYLSLGYALSVAQHSAWIYCKSEMQAEYII